MALHLQLPFHHGDKIPAFDPVLGQWLNASVIEVKKDSVQVQWVGYTKVSDAWIELKDVWHPEQERPLNRRPPIERVTFPKRMHSKHLQKGDHV